MTADNWLRADGPCCANTMGCHEDTHTFGEVWIHWG